MSESGSAVAPAGVPPGVQTMLTPGEVVDRVEALARRGKMPGFRRGSGGVLFSVEAFGKAFDYRLEARGESRDGGGCLLRFALRPQRRTPILFGVILAATVWPGVWLTDSMLRTYFSWYQFSLWGEADRTMLVTCLWYLPLTVLPIPFFWRRTVKTSRAAAAESARVLAERIRADVGAGRV